MKAEDELTRGEMGVRHPKNFPVVKRESIRDRDMSGSATSVQESLGHSGTGD